jgi:hypothetical protein
MSETNTSVAVAIELTGGPACGEVVLTKVTTPTVLREVRVRDDHAGKQWVARHAYNATGERSRKGALVYVHERCVGTRAHADLHPDDGKGGAL